MLKNKFALINKLTKETITIRKLNTDKIRIAEIMFGLAKSLTKKEFRKLYEVEKIKNGI